MIFASLYRNPSYRGRPTFRKLVEQFLQQTDILANVHSKEDIQNGFYVGAPIENGAHVYPNMQAIYRPHIQFGNGSKHYSYVRKQAYLPNASDNEDDDNKDDDEEAHDSLSEQSIQQWLSGEQGTDEEDITASEYDVVTMSSEYDEVPCEIPCQVQKNYECIPFTQKAEETDTNASGYYNILSSRENRTLNMTPQTSKITKRSEEESVDVLIPCLSPVYDYVTLPTVDGIHAATHTSMIIHERASPIYASTPITNGSSVSRKLNFNPFKGRLGRQK